MWTLRQLSMSTAAKLAAGEDPMVEASVVKELGNAFEQDMPRRVQAIVDCAWGDENDLAKLLRALLLASPSFSLRGGTREVIRGIIPRGPGLRLARRETCSVLPRPPCSPRRQRPAWRPSRHPASGFSQSP